MPIILLEVEGKREGNAFFVLVGWVLMVVYLEKWINRYMYDKRVLTVNHIVVGIVFDFRRRQLVHLCYP